jgi:hypothetical protein
MRRLRGATVCAAAGALGGGLYGCFGWPDRSVPLWLQPLPLLLLGGLAVWGAVRGGQQGDPRGDVLPGAVAGFIAGATAGVVGLALAFGLARVPGWLLTLVAGPEAGP